VDEWVFEFVCVCVCVRERERERVMGESACVGGGVECMSE
jgi:hypothetical protein